MQAHDSAPPRISMTLRDCAQSPWVLIVRSGDFPVDFHEGDGLLNGNPPLVQPQFSS
jgi:hypothetical protein